MKIAVVGTGYVGLVTGACFSEIGHEVTCVDVDAKKIEALRQGVIPIYEPGLDRMVATNAEQGRLVFTTEIGPAVEAALFVFIAVGTPPLEDGTADLQYVLAVARSIGQAMNGFRIVVTKSTVPVGTGEKVRETIQEVLDGRGADYEFDAVSNPEFLREGSAIDDFMTPDRIVIGCDDHRTSALMEELYATFAKDGHPILKMDTTSAEMTKYTANSMLAARISFINEMATICEAVGANVEQVRRGVGADRRIGYEFINPGVGYGGSCFPKDVKALIGTAKSHGCETRMLDAIEAVNETQKGRLVELMGAYYDGGLSGKRFAVWGLSFKPDTDDTREAPALVVIRALLQLGAEVRAYDPKATEEARLYLGEHSGLEFAKSAYEALEGCNALLLITEWSAFRNPDFARVKALLKSPVIFDGRNVYSRAVMAEKGFDYFSIGRVPVLAFSQGAENGPA